MQSLGWFQVNFFKYKVCTVTALILYVKKKSSGAKILMPRTLGPQLVNHSAVTRIYQSSTNSFPLEETEAQRG